MTFGIFDHSDRPAVFAGAPALPDAAASGHIVLAASDAEALEMALSAHDAMPALAGADAAFNPQQAALP